MAASLLAVLCFGSATFTRADADRLARERTEFFRRTSDLPGSGYFGGPEGSSHEVLFPVGRSDRLYYYSFSPGYPLEPKSPPLLSITAWRRQGTSLNKEWKVWFKPSDSPRPTSGTLNRMAFFMEFQEEVSSRAKSIKVHLRWFRPDPKSKGWRRGRAELALPQVVAAYSFGVHGDVSQSCSTYLYGPGVDQTRTAIAIDLDGPLTVSQHEVDLINDRRRKQASH